MYTNQQFSDVLQQVQQNSANYTASDVRAARERLIKAAEATIQLDQEIRRPTWKSKATHDDLRNRLQAARAEEDQATQHFNEVFRQAGWMEAQEKHQQREAERETERKKQQAQHAAAMEEQAKRELHDLYLLNGGTSEQFEAAWGGPSGMWSKELERRTLQGQNDLVEGMKSTGRYGI